MVSQEITKKRNKKKGMERFLLSSFFWHLYFGPFCNIAGAGKLSGHCTSYFFLVAIKHVSILTAWKKIETGKLGLIW